MSVNAKDVVCYLDLPIKVAIQPATMKALKENGEPIPAPNYDPGFDMPMWCTVYEALNIAYGFPDGNCNEMGPSGLLVSKAMSPEKEKALEDAAFMLQRTQLLTVRVAVLADGTFKLCKVT